MTTWSTISSTVLGGSPVVDQDVLAEEVGADGRDAGGECGDGDVARYCGAPQYLEHGWWGRVGEAGFDRAGQLGVADDLSDEAARRAEVTMSSSIPSSRCTAGTG
jgi:hypothetical protein